MSAPKTVFLGMSGGVDSSMAAVLLKEQGFRVVGVYMKNWSQDLPGMKCPWAEDLADAKRVAVKLGLDFKVFDFENEYKHKVVDYMLTEFKKGRTPNPDIMCNQEIKFKLFYEVAMEQGADFIATGHYAQTEMNPVQPSNNANLPDAAQPSANTDFLDSIRLPVKADSPDFLQNLQTLYLDQSKTPQNLLRAVDENKDQTYFLYRIPHEALAHTLFPIGHLTKPIVKKMAAERGLVNAYKKESMGVCFVGEVGMKDFLQTYLPVQPGQIIDADTQKPVGSHEGTIFYTVGQRHGLNLGGGLPYYVVAKDQAQNIVYVSKNLNHKNLWTTEIELEDIVLRNNNIKTDRAELLVRLRHRAPLIPAILQGNKLFFQAEIKRPAPGQSVVFYQDQVCLGGGIIK